MRRVQSPRQGGAVCARLGTLVLLAALLLCLVASAQQGSRLELQVEGPTESVIGESVDLKAVVRGPLGDALPDGASIEWVLDGQVIQKGSRLRCRANGPSVYQFTVNVVERGARGRRTLASTSHAVIFLKERPAPAPMMQPVGAPAEATAPKEEPREGAPVWMASAASSTVVRSTAEGTNDVALSPSAFKGVNRRACSGTSIATVRWSEPPLVLVPGTLVDIELAEELELVTDTDPSCPAGSVPLRGFASGKFSASYGRREDRSADRLTESARQLRERFEKSKTIRWRVPRGRTGDPLTIMLGGDVVAGSGYRYFTYRMQPYSAERARAPLREPVRAVAAAEPVEPEPTPVAAPVARRAAGLKVRLVPDETSYFLGDTAAVRAEVRGGREPYTFAWSGDVDVAGQRSDTALAMLREAGRPVIAVKVTDADDRSAQARLTLTVEAVPVRIAKEAPDGDTLDVLAPAQFSAAVGDGGREVVGAFWFQWQSDPEGDFQAEGRLRERATARFAAPGRTEVWVDAYRKIEDTPVKVGESGRLRLTVASPGVAMALDPAGPYVGEYVTATLATEPATAGMICDWMPLPRNAVRVGTSADGCALTFYLTDDREARIEASAATTMGESLGTAEQSVSARNYELRVMGPIASGRIPVVWKPGAGLVEAKDELAVEQVISFRAQLSPASRQGPVRYEWIANRPGCLIRHERTSRPLVSCTEPGDYTLTVTAIDSNGLRVASAAVPFSITVSKRDLETAEVRANAERLRAEASALLKDNKLQEAIAKYRESLAVWPDKELETHVTMLETDLAREDEARQHAAALKSSGFDLEERGDLAGAIAAYKESIEVVSDAELSAKVQKLERDLATRRALRQRGEGLKAEGQALEKEGKLRQAIARYTESLTVLPDAALASRIALLEAELEQQEAALVRARKLKADGKVLEQQGDVEGAMAKYRESLAARPDDEIAERLSNLQHKLALRREKQAGAAKLREEGRLLEASDRFVEALARYRASLELWSDPRVQQRIDELQAEVARRVAKENEARRLSNEGEILEKHGRRKAAMEKYKQSLAAWPDEEVSRRLAVLEAEQAQEEADRRQAEKLTVEAYRLEKQDKYQAALTRYRESLRLWPRKRLEQHVAALEGRLAEQAQRAARALALKKEGGKLEDRERYEAALARYRESYGLVEDVAVSRKIAQIEGILAARRARDAEGRALRDAGFALETVGKIEEALVKYRASLAVIPDRELENHLAVLEEDLARQRARHEQAAQLEEEGDRLAAEGREEEALNKYRASIAIEPSDEVSRRIGEVEALVDARRVRQAKAAELAKLGARLEKKDDLTGALAKYEASLEAWPDETVRGQVAAVKTELARRQEQQAREAARHKEAAQLKAEGEKLEADRQVEAAVAKYRASLAAWSDPELEEHVKEIEERQAERAARRKLAVELIAEARRFEGEGDLGEAIAKLRASLAVWPARNIERKIAELEDVKAEQDARLAEAVRLREEGDRLAAEGREEEALVKYETSLEAWPDEALRSKLALLKAEVERKREELALEKARRDEAARLRAEGDALQEERQTKEAIEKYRASLAAWPDAALEAQVEQLATQFAEQEAKRRIALELIDEARRFEADGNLEDAIAKLRSSVAVWPGENAEKKLAELEARKAERDARIAEAARLRQEGDQLAAEGREQEALASYRASLAAQPDEELARRADEMEAMLERRMSAARLDEEGAELEAAGDLEGALAKYEASLAEWPEDSLRSKVTALKAELARQEEERVRQAAQREKAAGLRAEGDALEKKGKSREALEKYRASLAAWADEEVETLAGEIETRLAEQEAKQRLAEELIGEARLLEDQRRIEDAIAKLRASVAVWPGEEAEKKLAALEKIQSEREKQRAAALQLKERGALLEEAGEYAEAAARYRESVELLPDPDLQRKIDDLERQVAEREAQRASAQTLRAEGRRLETAGKIEVAILKYEESLSLVPDADTEKRLAALRKDLAERQEREQRAAKLRAEGDWLAAAGRQEEALERFRASLAAMPSDEVTAQIERLETAITERREKQRQAAELEEAGEKMEEQGDLESAITLYGKSLEVWPDESLKAKVAMLRAEVERRQEALARRETDRVQGAQLRAEGDALEKEGKLRDAVQKYRESLAVWPDDKLVARVARLERTVSAEDAKRKLARTLNGQAGELERAGKVEEAIAKYRASLAIWPSRDIEARVGKLEKKRGEWADRASRAALLKEEGAFLEKQGDYGEALEKYRQSVELKADTELLRRIAEVEAMKKAQDARLAEATRLRDEGKALETAGRIKAAVAKYRESLQVEPDAALEQHVRRLERRPAVVPVEVARAPEKPEVPEPVKAVPEAPPKKMESARDRAGRLKDEGAALEQAGQIRPAVEKYKESLDAWPDSALATKLVVLEGQLARREAKMTREEADLAEALRLNEEGRGLEADGDLAGAVENYRRSLELREDRFLEEHVAEIEEKLSRQDAARKNALELQQEGDALRHQGKEAEAITVYEQSLAIYPNPELAALVKQLETTVSKREERRRRAESLRAEARRFESEGKLEEAVAAYRFSLDVWPDGEVEKKIAALQARIEEEAQIADARKLQAEGYALFRGGDLDGAIAKYQASLAVHEDASLRLHVQKLQAEAARREAEKARAAALRNEAAKLLDQGKLEEAIAKYRECLRAWPDKEVERHVAMLEKDLARQKADQARAARLRAEGDALERKGDYEQAIARYRDSLRVRADPELEKYVWMLESQMKQRAARRAKADQYIAEAQLLEQRGDFTRAIATYRKALQHWPDEEWQRYVDRLESEVSERERRDDTAEQLWRRGQALAKQGRYEAALVSLRQSLQYRYRGDRAEYVEQIERRMGMPSTAAPVATVAEARAATRPAAAAPRVAGSQWSGVMIVRGDGGSMQWPLRVTVSGDNNISGSYRAADAGSTASADYRIGGTYDPSTGRFYMGFSRTQQGRIVRGTLDGRASSTAAAGGDLKLGGRPPLTGVWRLVRAE